MTAKLEKKTLVFKLMGHVGLYPWKFTSNSYNESHLLFSRFQILSKCYVLFYSQMKSYIILLLLTTLATIIVKL